MYFQRFPKTVYTQDDLDSIQLVTSIFIRTVFSDEIKNNLSLYDEYDVKDGETPEILADIFYDNPELHWIILHTNEILDPRFDWVLSTPNLINYAQEKYSNVYGIHHYENASEVPITGNIILNSSAGFGSFSVGQVIKNNSGAGNAVIMVKHSSSNVQVLVSNGGFKLGDNVALVSNANVQANLTATSSVVGTAVTNLQYESRLNEEKRRIKILKPQYVDAITSELNRKLENIDG